MPTGYTDMIKDDTTFKQFAMRCARAFGACITMRDDPIDKDIPVFHPSDWHINSIARLEKELEEVKNMTDEEAAVKSKEEHDKRVSELQSCIDKANKTRLNYERILEEVRKWVPPSNDHEEMKRFMVEQIETSIDFDCKADYYEEQMDDMTILSGPAWKQEKIKKCEDELKYHKEKHDEEIERVNNRNEWVQKLKESLDE